MNEISKKNYATPAFSIVFLEGEVFLNASVEGGDHFTQPGNNWTGPSTSPTDKWTNWY